jgi:hypothetical protein
MTRLRAITFLLIFTISYSYAQKSNPYSGVPKANPLRQFVSKFTVSGSIGYGASFHNHEITGVGLINNLNGKPLLFDNTFVVTDTIPVTFENWVNNPTSVLRVPIDTTSFLLGTDSLPVIFRANGTNIPINISVHYTFDRYRLGAGYTFEPYFIGDYKPSIFKDSIASFKTNFSASHYNRWYVYFGGEVFKTKRYMVVVDAKFGSYSLAKKHFNPDIIKKGLFFNLGVRFEKSLSEYVKVYVRPSFEFKNYTLTFPESNYSITHSIPAFYANIGVSWRLPDLHRCPISNCKTQIHHHHRGKKYRSRAHPFWKWQDPDYGENYPKLIRYKNKNKKRISPY